MKKQLAVSLVMLLSFYTQSFGIAIVAKGFLLDRAGELATSNTEVISGAASIKGDYFGTGAYTPFFTTDPSILRFAAGQTYKTTFRYKIITPATQGFEVLFYSPAAGAKGEFLPSLRIDGVAGVTGTGTLTNTLGAFSDYQVRWNIVATGAIVIDDVEILNVGTNQVAAREDAEGGNINPGILGFRFMDSKSYPIGVPGMFNVLRSATVHDLDGDGSQESILTITTYPEQIPQPVIVLGSEGNIAFRTRDFFPDGVRSLKHSPLTLFSDLDGDGREDIVFTEAGIDHPPWTGSAIGVALNTGRGTYVDVSSFIPEDLQTTRSASLGVGNVYNDGQTHIVLPDKNDGSNTATLHWNGNGFDVRRNWIDRTLWQYPGNLGHHNWMGVVDMDGDGRQDLLLAGRADSPSLRILFGSSSGFAASNVLELHDGPFGHITAPFDTWNSIPMLQGADVNNVVVADLNNDGLLDIFSLQEQVIHVAPGALTDRNLPNFADLFANGGTYYADIGLQVYLNQGQRRFVDVSSASSKTNVGRKLYEGVMPVDMNNDGFIDVVGVYHFKTYGTDPGFSWGTTFFLNDGTGAFQVVEGIDLLPASTLPGIPQVWGIGSFLPTKVTSEKVEGLLYESLTIGILNVYKIESERPLGTGPGFANSASLGVPGFNEFYYLRNYPDAVAAVKAGQYSSGLSRYIHVGRNMGYRTSAANGSAAPISQLPVQISDHSALSLNAGATAPGLQVGYGRVVPDPTRTTPAGLAIFGYTQNGVLVSESAVAASPLIRSGRIYAEIGNGANTGIAIANPNDQAATITFYYTNSSGASVLNGTMTVPAKGQVAAFLDQLPFVAEAAPKPDLRTVRTFTLQSTQPVGITALRGYLNERSEFLITTLPVCILDGTPTGEVAFPHFASGDGWISHAVLINPTDSVISGNLQIRPNGSSPGSIPYAVPGRSAVKIEIAGGGSGLQTGWVNVAPAPGNTTPSGVLIFAYQKEAVRVSEAGIPAISQGSAFRVYAEGFGDFDSAQTNSVQTGIAISNPSNTSANVNFELFALDGTPTGFRGSTTIPGGGQKAMFLSQIPGFAAMPRSFQGVLRVSGSGFQLTGLRGRYNQRGDFLITTTSPVDEAGPVSSAELVFPHLAVGGGYATQFILFSGKAGHSAVLKFINQTGQPLFLSFN